MTRDQKLVLKDVPSWSEVEKIIGTLIRRHKQGSVSLRDLCIEGLLATTGIRTSELLALRKEDFDFNQGLVTVRQLKKKGEFVRQTVMSDDLKPYLEEYLKGVRGSRPAFKLTRRQVLNITHRYTAEIIGRP
jgi:integrase